MNTIIVDNPSTSPVNWIPEQSEAGKKTPPEQYVLPPAIVSDDAPTTQPDNWIFEKTVLA